MRSFVFVFILILCGISCSQTDDILEDTEVNVESNKALKNSGDISVNASLSQNGSIEVFATGGNGSYQFSVTGPNGFNTSSSKQGWYARFSFSPRGYGVYYIQVSDSGDNYGSTSINYTANGLIGYGLPSGLKECGHSGISILENLGFNQQEQYYFCKRNDNTIEFQIYMHPDVPYEMVYYLTIEDVSHPNNIYYYKNKYQYDGYTGGIFHNDPDYPHFFYTTFYLKDPTPQNDPYMLKNKRYIIRLHGITFLDEIKNPESHIKKCTHYYESSPVWIPWSDLSFGMESINGTFTFRKMYSPIQDFYELLY